MTPELWTVLPVRGLTHGLELIFRIAAREGLRVEAPDAEPYRALRRPVKTTTGPPRTPPPPQVAASPGRYAGRA